MPSNPVISIITVVYNAASVLEQTILSVIEQNYDNIDFVIIDGGSKDNTIDIIKKYEGRITFWMSEKDNGVYDAMNKAVKHAKGDYLYFLGAGDILYNVLHIVGPQLIDKQTIYYGDVYRRDLNTTYDGHFGPYKLAVNNICHQAIFYPAAVFQKHQYNNRYKIFADHVLNMHLYGDKQFKFKYLPVTVSDYEGDGLSATTPDVNFINDRLQIIRSNFGFPVYLYAFLRKLAARLTNRQSAQVLQQIKNK